MNQQSPFALFIDRARFHFRFLIDDFSFQEADAGSAGRDAAVIFRKGDLRISVSRYELCHRPWVAIDRLARRGSRMLWGDNVSLDVLRKERGAPPPEVIPFDDIPDDRLDMMLAEDAAALKTLGHDLLTGNVASLQQASKKTMEAAAKREAELYGDRNDH